MKIVFLLLLIAALVLSVGWLAAAAPERPDLTGRVLHEDGSPIPKATVFVYTAGPRQGTAMLCPSCYADCNKQATTDSAGQFTLASLDPKLLFKLLVVAAGHECTFVPKTDPANGEVEITLRKRSHEVLSAFHRITGVVMNEEGNPIVGAVISSEGVEKGAGTQWGGTDAFVDPVAVADADGFFVLPAKPEVRTVHAMAQAPSVAKRWVTLNAGKDHIVRMVEGVTITGRVLRDGQPLKDVVVGLSTVERRCGSFLHEFEAVTDQAGRFLLMNVTPDNEYYYFAKMESLRAHGALPVGTVQSGASGKTVALGDLKVQPAHHLIGRVVLSNGGRVPPDTRLFLAREHAWDHTEVILDSNGRFEMTGVPEEPVSIGVRVKGYKMSKRNPSLDWMNGGIVGIVDRDMEDFRILLEPGEWRSSREEEDQPSGSDAQPYDKPLRSSPGIK